MYHGAGWGVAGTRWTADKGGLYLPCWAHFATLVSELININNHVHVISSWYILVQTSDRPGKNLLEIARLKEG